MLDISKLVSRGGSFRVALSGAVQDLTLLGIASEYENNVMRKVAGVSPEDWKKRVLSDDPVLETTKYDGEGVFVYFEAGKQLFVFSAPSGRARIGFPALTEAGKKLDKAGVKKALVRCELWLPPSADGKKRGIADVTRATFNGTDAETNEFKLVALDMIMMDGKDLRANQTKFKETWELLKKIFGEDSTHGSFRMVGSLVPEKTLADVFTRKTGAGEEGIVIRRLDRPEMVKIKPYRSIDAVVVGFVEGELETSYGVTSLLVALNYPNTASTSPDDVWLQTFVRVGTGFSDPERVSILSALQPLKVPPPLAMTDSDGRTVHFIKPERIAEIGGEDLVTQIGGVENRTQLLLWNRATGSYTFSGLTPVPRLTFARFVRWREDKALDNGGARLEQILTNPVRPEVRPMETRKTRVVKRAVYTKGAEMVRKLVIVQNPVGEEAGFPFSVFWTDFSSKRATPLKVLTQVAKTEARAIELGEIYIKENILKGWGLIKLETSPTPEPEPAPVPVSTPTPPVVVEVKAEPVLKIVPKADVVPPPAAQPESAPAAVTPPAVPTPVAKENLPTVQLGLEGIAPVTEVAAPKKKAPPRKKKES